MSLFVAHRLQTWLCHNLPNKCIVKLLIRSSYKNIGQYFDFKYQLMRVSNLEMIRVDFEGISMTRFVLIVSWLIRSKRRREREHP
jgi:hypothetical protein